MKKLILLLPFVLLACKSAERKEVERLEAEYAKAKIETLKAEQKHRDAVEEYLIMKK